MGDKELQILNRLIEPSENPQDAMRQIIDRVQKIEANVLEADNENQSDQFFTSLDTFEKHIEPQLELIRDVLLPRLMNFSSNQELIDSLTTLDQLTQFGKEVVFQVTFMMTNGLDSRPLHEPFGTYLSKLLIQARLVYSHLESDL